MRFQIGMKTLLGLSVCMLSMPRGLWEALLEGDRLVYLAEEISRQVLAA